MGRNSQRGKIFLLYDCHIHSTCSTDGRNTMEEMALASFKNGVGYICFTDHCDIDDYMTGLPIEGSYDHREKTIRMFDEAVKKAPSGLQLHLGMELGAGNHDLERAREIAASPELDFVLGSLHNLKGKKDFYEYSYESEAQCHELMDEYATELIELAGMDFFDTMAHIGYTIRYMRRDGFDVSFNLENYGDKIEVLLKTLIQNGRGLEINCSGCGRERIGGPMPEVEVLRLYRQLGGEIITIGSDAHSVSRAASGLKQGFDILKELGYKYITVFEKRKPRFIKI